jgi:ammonia channel protein AmtB
LHYGDTKRFFRQSGEATLCAFWAFGATYVVSFRVDKVKWMRVAPEVEREGLDIPEFAIKAYPEDPAIAAE